MNFNDALKNMARSEHNVTVLRLFELMFPESESNAEKIRQIEALGGIVPQSMRGNKGDIPSNKVLGSYNLTDDEVLRLGKTLFNSIRAFSGRKNQAKYEACPYYQLANQLEERYTYLVGMRKISRGHAEIIETEMKIRQLETNILGLNNKINNLSQGIEREFPGYYGFMAVMQLAHFAREIEHQNERCGICCKRLSSCECFDD